MKLESIGAAPSARTEESRREQPERAPRAEVGELSVSRLYGPDELDRRLGITRLDGGTPAQSKLPALLGASRLVPVRAVPVAGKVAWVNFPLARELGFNVPDGNRMTPEFHRELMDHLALTTLPKGEDAPNAVTVEADRYGGTGLGVSPEKKRATGAGRAAFISKGNLNIKGIGRTPLAQSARFDHNHGGAPMREGFLEAIWGEVNHNLFSAGSTRILAVIDTGDATTWKDGKEEPRALIVRAGRQLRPAHLVENGDSAGFARDVFVRATQDSGDLVERDGRPDIEATMRRVIQRHARTAAEQVRWRVLHGALSTSNMELDGGQLDLGTITSQPRTAPIKVLDFKEGYGREHLDRAEQLSRMYDALRSAMTPAQRKSENAARFSVTRELKEAYAKELKTQMVQASGLKPEIAQALGDSRETTAFADLVQEMAKMKNRGGSLNADKTVTEDVAVLDVFNLLRRYPELYFANPTGDHTAQIRDLLQPFVRGSRSTQYRRKAQIEALANRFAVAFDDLMKAAATKSSEFYDRGNFARAVSQRAAFENAPLDQLYRAKLHDKLNDAITSYRGSGDTQVFKAAADEVVASSLRSVSGLIAQGSHRMLSDGGVALEERTIAGVDYRVQAWLGGKREVQVEVPATGNDHDGYVLSTLPGTPHLHRDQVDALRYRFSTDGWKTWQEAPAYIDWRDGKPYITMTIPQLAGDTGQLEGLFHCTASGDFFLHDHAGGNFSGYVFAVPDDHELKAFRYN